MAATNTAVSALPPDDRETDLACRLNALRHALAFLEDEARHLGAGRVAAIIAAAVDASDLALGREVGRPVHLDA